LVEVIEQEEPAIFICHWPGIYYNGEKLGFNIFKTVVNRLHEKYDHLLWMKLSEIARYWAAKTYTKIELEKKSITFSAPFATDLFTVRIPRKLSKPSLQIGGNLVPLQQVDTIQDLDRNTWCREDREAVVCFDLPFGECEIMD
jgi:hypothetical protein